MRPICYVCAHEITGDPVYIGQEKYRHIRCAPGSTRWLEIQASKKPSQRSEMYEFFKLADEGRKADHSGSD